MTDSEDASDSENQITLGLLDAVHEDGKRSQRSFANDLGIALGLTNAYLKRCIRKGFIKATEVPANRYAYYLTPKGFSEKSRLTAQYLKNSFEFYRGARNQIDGLLAGCVDRRWSRICLAGTGDLAEIAILCSMQHQVEIVGIIEPGAAGEQFIHRPVVGRVADLGHIDAIIITDVSAPERRRESILGEISAERMLAPALLKLSPLPNQDGVR